VEKALIWLGSAGGVGKRGGGLVVEERKNNYLPEKKKKKGCPLRWKGKEKAFPDPNQSKKIKGG